MKRPIIAVFLALISGNQRNLRIAVINAVSPVPLWLYFH